MRHIYELKSNSYYKNVRHDIISLIPPNPIQKILEVGAGGGYTLEHIRKHNLANEVMGIDIFELPNTMQKSPLIERFIIADIEKEFLSLGMQRDYYDVIICGDVLEHLIDPWTVVKNLSQCLKTGGIMIISVPNIREISVAYSIFFRGDFRYNPDGGILDKTHLRFFCKKNAIDLACTNEMKLRNYYSNLDLVRVRSKRKVFNAFTLGLLRDILTIQHLVVTERR